MRVADCGTGERGGEGERGGSTLIVKFGFLIFLEGVLGVLELKLVGDVGDTGGVGWCSSSCSTTTSGMLSIFAITSGVEGASTGISRSSPDG